jgi:hypothetical protein
MHVFPKLETLDMYTIIDSPPSYYEFFKIIDTITENNIDKYEFIMHTPKKSYYKTNLPKKLKKNIVCIQLKFDNVNIHYIFDLKTYEDILKLNE